VFAIARSTHEHDEGRRRFLKASALGIAMVMSGSPVIGGIAQQMENVSRPDRRTGEMEIVKIVAKPLPEKVYNTESVGISRKTHDEHYKLYQGYVNKANEIREKLAALDKDPAKANQTYSDIRVLKVEYTFALGGVKNHELYFDILGGKGGAPTGPVAEWINKYFGSYEAWAQDLKATGIAARGWVWLALDHDDGSLFNYIGDAQNTFPIWNATPILALDTYEHAYYYDFQTARAKYIDAFLQTIDWDAVNARLEQALKMYNAGR
jgi:Fe-Mn family superoxide dismutase